MRAEARAAALEAEVNELLPLKAAKTALESELVSEKRRAESAEESRQRLLLAVRDLEESLQEEQAQVAELRAAAVAAVDVRAPAADAATSTAQPAAITEEMTGAPTRPRSSSVASSSPALGGGRAPSTAREEALKARLKDAEFALETQQETYKGVIADLTASCARETASRDVLAAEVAQLDATLATVVDGL